MGYQTRLPAAPLKRELRRVRCSYGITWKELADRLQISSRTLTRLLGARDVAEPVADRLACRLGLHPVLIWPREWLHIANQENDISRREIS
jgi:plasmid maintenance system antidote protein VapI